MAIERFPETVPLDFGYEVHDARPHSVHKFAGLKPQVATFSGRDFRVMENLRAMVNPTERALLKTFRENIVTIKNSFLLKDPTDHDGANWVVGTGNASDTVFDLPTTGDEGRHFVDDVGGTFSVEVNSVAATATIQTDARTITITSGTPGVGHSIELITYEFFLRGRLTREMNWRPMSVDIWEYFLSFEEVPVGG